MVGSRSICLQKLTIFIGLPELRFHRFPEATYPMHLSPMKTEDCVLYSPPPPYDEGTSSQLIHSDALTNCTHHLQANSSSEHTDCQPPSWDEAQLNTTAIQSTGLSLCSSRSVTHQHQSIGALIDVGPAGSVNYAHVPILDERHPRGNLSKKVRKEEAEIARRFSVLGFMEHPEQDEGSDNKHSRHARRRDSSRGRFQNQEHTKVTPSTPSNESSSSGRKSRIPSRLVRGIIQHVKARAPSNEQNISSRSLSTHETS
ncbi:hypothetical protein C8Q75DRAFT_239454 [Abortiporus biennis]|nr:hypothetical protein C8Q75DRAFT_239454 [Abortiporus biennis]